MLIHLALIACTDAPPTDSGDSECATTTWHLDADGDGFGSPDRTLEACEAPDGYVADDTDCDDLDAQAYPGNEPTWFPDQDGDGFGDPTAEGLVQCEGPPGSVTNALDCDDGDAAISPADNEICDGIDNDCDGLVDDEDEVLAASLTAYFEDADGDGFGDGEAEDLCEQPSGWVELDGDCDDRDGDRFPGAPEICHDGMVQDCDGDEAAALAECWWDAETETEAAAWSITDDAYYPFWRSQHVADVTGDGVDDLVVGDGWRDSDGAVFVQQGPLTSSSALGEDITLTGEDYLGTSVGVGDLDGDGTADLLIGEPGVDEAGSNAGRALVVLGPLTGGAAQDAAVLEIDGLGSNDQLGQSVAIVDDVSGDGAADLVVGTIWYDDEESNVGAIWLLHGQLTGTADVTQDAFASVVGEDSSTYLGNDETVTHGDLDGDGAADLLVGAMRASPYGQSNEGDEDQTGYEGLVGVFWGPVAGDLTLSDADSWLMGHAERQAYAGSVVESGFDWDGDGLDDLATGAPGYIDEDTQDGALYVWVDTPTYESDLTAGHLVILGDTDDQLGGDVAVADLDGDGALDLVVGSGQSIVSANSASTNSGGGAWIFYGPLSGTLTPADAATNFEGSDHLGGEVLVLPDHDADGARQVAISDLDYSYDSAIFVFDHPAY